MFPAASPRRSRSHSRSRRNHPHHHNHHHHHHPHPHRSHSRHSSKSGHSHHSHHSGSRSRSRSRSRPRSHSRLRPRSMSPPRYPLSPHSFHDSPPDSLSGASTLSDLPMRRSTSFTDIRQRDPPFFDDPTLFPDLSPSFHSASVPRADSLDGIPSSHHRRHGHSRTHDNPHHESYPNDHQLTSYPVPLIRFPARTPGLTFPSPKSFVVHIANLSAGTPWMQLTDEMGGRRLLLGTGSTLTPSGEATLIDETTGPLVTLCRSHTTGRRGVADVRIVTQNRYGEPLMTASMPSVSDPHRKNEQFAQHGYDGAMAGMQAYAPYGYAAHAWGGAGNYMATQMPNYTGAYGQAAYPWQQSMYTTPYSHYDYIRGRRHFANVGDVDPDYSRNRTWDTYGDASVVALFFAGERGYERRSKRKQRMPLFKLVRSADGMREWLQGIHGRELASITYTVAGQAGFAAQGGIYRLFVQAGVDVAMVAAALASRIWIWAETGVTH